MRPGLGFRLAWLTGFGVAFGVVEAAIVVYLRDLIFPGGFAVPFALPSGALLHVELVREAATIVVLLSAAMLTGPGPWFRFGAFCVAFGVWDTAYYLGLKLMLGWPASVMEWDLLFLLPVVWVGPVLSAVLMALSLIFAGGTIMARSSRVRPYSALPVWGLAAVSLAFLLWSFTANHAIVRETGIPGAFPWGRYSIGFLLGWLAFVASFFVFSRPR